MGNYCSSGFKKTAFKREGRKPEVRKSESRWASARVRRDAAQEEARWLNRPALKLGRGDTLRDDYVVAQEALGRGRTAIVWSGVDRSTGAPVAVKRCTKKQLAPSRKVTEIEIMLRLQRHREGVAPCRRIPRLLATYEDSKRLYLVTDLCSGGDLYRHIAEESNGFSEERASRIARQLLEALAHFHGNDVVHRDVKPENVLFVSEGSSHVQLVDLGSAVVLPDIGPRSLRSPLPSAGHKSFFSAPEVLSHQEYTEGSDMWSLGALLYVILGCTPPPTAGMDLQASPAWLQLSVGQIAWLPANTSPALEDLLRRLLSPRISARLSARDALQHPWITGDGEGPPLEQSPLTEAQQHIRHHVEERKRMLLTSHCFYVQENGGECTIRRTSDVSVEQMERWRKAKPVKVSAHSKPTELRELRKQVGVDSSGRSNSSSAKSSSSSNPHRLKDGTKFFVEVLPDKKAMHNHSGHELLETKDKAKEKAKEKLKEKAPRVQAGMGGAGKGREFAARIAEKMKGTKARPVWR